MTGPNSSTTYPYNPYDGTTRAAAASVDYNPGTSSGYCTPAASPCYNQAAAGTCAAHRGCRWTASCSARHCPDGDAACQRRQAVRPLCSSLVKQAVSGNASSPAPLAQVRLGTALACLSSWRAMSKFCPAGQEGRPWRGGPSKLPALPHPLQACSMFGMCGNGTSVQQCATCKSLLHSTAQALAGALTSQQGEPVDGAGRPSSPGMMPARHPAGARLLQTIISFCRAGRALP